MIDQPGAGGGAAPAPVCSQCQQVRESARLAVAEVHAILEQAKLSPGHRQLLTELAVQLGQARKREQAAAAAYQAHVESDHGRWP